MYVCIYIYIYIYVCICIYTLRMSPPLSDSTTGISSFPGIELFTSLRINTRYNGRIDYSVSSERHRQCRVNEIAHVSTQRPDQYRTTARGIEPCPSER